MDAALFRAIHLRWVHPALDDLMVVLSIVVPALCLGHALLPRRPKSTTSWWGTLRTIPGGAFYAMAAAAGAAVLLQLVFGRARPPVERPVFGEMVYYGFPSGHAAIVAAFAVWHGLRARRAAIWAALVLLALGVGWSRVYLGHHFPSDVLVGWGVGASFGVFVAGRARTSGERPGWAWWLWPQLALVGSAIAAATLGLLDVPILRVPGADKIAHFGLFGLLAFLLVGYVGRPAALRWLVLLAGVAAAEELAQAVVSTRTFDLVDLAFTQAGIWGLGWLARSSGREGQVSASGAPRTWDGCTGRGRSARGRGLVPTARSLRRGGRAAGWPPG